MLIIGVLMMLREVFLAVLNPNNKSIGPSRARKIWIKNYQRSCYCCYRWLSAHWFYSCCTYELIISADDGVLNFVFDVPMIVLHLLKYLCYYYDKALISITTLLMMARCNCFWECSLCQWSWLWNIGKMIDYWLCCHCEDCCFVPKLLHKKIFWESQGKC